jgi:hypothetical protein
MIPTTISGSDSEGPEPNIHHSSSQHEGQRVGFPRWSDSLRDCDEYHLRPMTTMIDINPHSNCQKRTRRSSSANHQRNQTVRDDWVRVILNEVTDTKQTRLFHNATSPSKENLFAEVGEAFENRVPLIINLKNGTFRDGLKPIVDAVRDTLPVMSQISFIIRRLHDLWRSKPVGKNKPFVVQSNLQASAFPRYTKQPSRKDEFVLISGPRRIYNSAFSYRAQFWKAFVETEIDWMEQAALGKQLNCHTLCELELV